MKKNNQEKREERSTEKSETRDLRTLAPLALLPAALEVTPVEFRPEIYAVC